MCLDYFRHCLEGAQAMPDLRMRGPDPNDGGNAATHKTGIDPGRVTFNDALLLESFDTGSDGRL
jgi:hypothetical protein